ncbi:MAG: PTS sugar transporter subunit IIA [Planctomycetota bacterium]
MDPPATGSRRVLFPLDGARKRRVLVSDFPFAPFAWRRFIRARCDEVTRAALAAAMKLSELITSDLVEVPLRAADKWEALAAIARIPARAGRYPQSLVPTVEPALVVREKSMTTGMEDGIAIPHAAIDGIDELIAVLGLNPVGIPFETLDGAPARIIIGLVIPRARKLAHIKTLAEIAKLLSRAEVRERLLRCTDAESAVRALAEVQGAPR